MVDASDWPEKDPAGTMGPSLLPQAGLLPCKQAAHHFLAGPGRAVEGPVTSGRVQCWAPKSAWEAESAASPGPKVSPGGQKYVCFLPKGFAAAPSKSLGYDGIILVEIRDGHSGQSAALVRKPSLSIRCAPS